MSTRHTHRAAAFSRQRGFSFFEVLIAALILGVGVLGFAGLQVRALDSTGIAHFRAQATILAMDMSERIRMGDAGITLDHNAYEVATWWNGSTVVPAGDPGSWSQSSTCLRGTPSIPCNEAGMVRADVLEMRYLTQQLLPAGTMSVRPCEAGSTLTCIFVGWGGQDAVANCQFGVPNDRCVALQVYF